jgi:hypothetical protein
VQCPRPNATWTATEAIWRRRTLRRRGHRGGRVPHAVPTDPWLDGLEPPSKNHRVSRIWRIFVFSQRVRCKLISRQNAIVERGDCHRNKLLREQEKSGKGAASWATEPP